MERFGTVSCPLCRKSLSSGDIIKVHFPSIECLAVSERVRLTTILKDLQSSYIGRTQEHLKGLSLLHKKTLQLLNHPTYAGKKTVNKKLPEILASLNSELYSGKLDEVERGLYELTFRMNSLIAEIQSPERLVEFDLSSFLVKAVIKAAVKKVGASN